MSKTYAYCRVSSRKIKGKSRQSTDSQKYSLDVWSKTQKRKPIFFEDYATGTNTRREKLQKLLTTVVAGDTIVVSDLSRFSRSVKDTLVLVEDLMKRGVILQCLNPGLTFDKSAMSQFVLVLMSAIGQLDSQVKGERIRQALQLRRSQGVKLGRSQDTRLRQRILKMQRQDMPVSEIALTLGKSRQAVYQMLQRIAG
jgi:DNA invertase Pin-like site-specific DNA recombinase